MDNLADVISKPSFKPWEVSVTLLESTSHDNQLERNSPNVLHVELLYVHSENLLCGNVAQVLIGSFGGLDPT